MRKYFSEPIKRGLEFYRGHPDVFPTRLNARIQTFTQAPDTPLELSHFFRDARQICEETYTLEEEPYKRYIQSSIGTSGVWFDFQPDISAVEQSTPVPQSLLSAIEDLHEMTMVVWSLQPFTRDEVIIYPYTFQPNRTTEKVIHILHNGSHYERLDWKRNPSHPFRNRSILQGLRT
jgi:hypothetical protein